jgi:phosphomannomutase
MPTQAPLIISISGIRGLVGQSLTNDVVAHFCSAFATALPAGAGVVLARDTRPSGAEFIQIAAQALSRAGCRVYDLGTCPTPTAKLMVTELGAGGAIIITASHNPAPWNGLKLVRSDGIFLNAEQGKRVEALFHQQNFRQQGGGTIEKVPFADVKKLHIERILAHVDAAAIRRARFVVSIDPCNGTGGLMLPDLLAALGVEAHFINAEPNGDFAHEPEPVPANLGQLGQAVRQSGSALGFAIDPDADRVTLVDSAGQAVGEDCTLALAVQAVTSRQSGPVVTTLSTSQAISDAAIANGCPVFLTPVGEVHVVEKMLAERAIIGGEGNGGVILTQIDPGRDAAVGLVLVLEAMASRNQSLRELLAALPSYFIEKRKATCSPEQLKQTINALLTKHPQAYVHPVQDGSKLYMSGELKCPWVHLRASNTEPIVRIIAEAASQREASELCDEVEQILAESKV